VSLADVADNYLTFAWTDLDKKKQRDPSGISAFIVERDFKGFSSATVKEKWGILAGNTGFFKMEEVEVPRENLVAREGEGFKIAMFALDQGRYTVASGATGLIRACRDASVSYAGTRKTFGVEIGAHQLVKEMIAQMESDYQASRLLWLRAGWLKNVGRRNTRETGLAKWFATSASERAAADAVQVHGANGYSDEYPVGRYYRNCKGAVIYEGTREIHKLMQADYALGYRQDKPVRCSLPAIESRCIACRGGTSLENYQENTMTPSQPEPWLRGPVPGIPTLLQPAAHAFLLALEDVEVAVSDVSVDQLWLEPGGAASLGFHLLHLTGSTDRLLTYAR